MTAVSEHTGWSTSRRTALPRWAQVLLVAMAAVLAISLPNLLDPMIRHDDYPAYFADPAGFWAKTLHEGRWLNYLWHLREVVTPAWLNFAAYQLLWATFAACTALTFLRRDSTLFFPITLALLILVGPPATLISLWFNTLLPGLAGVALYALLGLILSRTIHLALMPLFVIASFMAYTTYPLLILAVVLARHPNRSFLHLTGVMALFIASFAAAVFTVYAINWQVHGIFGVPLASWREASPATDMTSLIANWPLVTQSFTDFLVRSSFDFTPAAIFHLAMLTGGTAVLLRYTPRQALALHAGLWCGMALIVVQILKLGVIVPPRSFIFAWVFYALIITRAAQILTDQGGVQGRMARNFVLLIVGSYLLQTFQQYATYRDWQADTAYLADTLAPLEGPVALQGDPLALPSAQSARIQNARALPFRIRQLGGPTVLNCATQDCSAATADLTISLNAQGKGAISIQRR